MTGCGSIVNLTRLRVGSYNGPWAAQVAGLLFAFAFSTRIQALAFALSNHFTHAHGLHGKLLQVYG